MTLHSTTQLPNLTDLSDEAIVEKILSENDHELFSVLYDRYEQKVYHKCISFSKESADAKDLLHDVFLKTFLNLSKFSGKSSFSTWLYSITYNYCVDYARKKSKHRYKDVDEMYDISDSDDEANERELMSMRGERLKDILEQIDPKHKMILLMKYQDDFAIKEITEMLGISESACKMRIKRAKEDVVSRYRTRYANEL